MLHGMNNNEFDIVTIASRPGLAEAADRICGSAWPTFMLQDDIVERHFFSLYRQYPQFQFVMFRRETDQIVAVGNCVPLPYTGMAGDLPDGGVDWILTSRFEEHADESIGEVLFALQIVVAEEYQSRGLSRECVKAMVAIGREHRCKALYAPVRPSHKAKYPRIPMEHYITWTDGDGLPFDPWMRVHARLGATVIGVCRESMYIDGTVSEWETWTGLQFPETGTYEVPGGLVPVAIDRAADIGEYIEPNVWMAHRI
jgi:GNAT superfamily N-acetyltransferase